MDLAACLLLAAALNSLAQPATEPDREPLLATSFEQGTPIESTRASPQAEGACALERPGSATVSIALCLQCHRQDGYGHPVGMSYRLAASRLRYGSPLRDEAEAVRRGVSSWRRGPLHHLP